MTAFLLDMDGVLYLGSRVLPGAREFVAGIARQPHLFITNNPTRSPTEVARRLADMGLEGIRAHRAFSARHPLAGGSAPA